MLHENNVPILPPNTSPVVTEWEFGRPFLSWSTKMSSILVLSMSSTQYITISLFRPRQRCTAYQIFSDIFFRSEQELVSPNQPHHNEEDSQSIIHLYWTTHTKSQMRTRKYNVQSPDELLRELNNTKNRLAPNKSASASSSLATVAWTDTIGRSKRNESTWHCYYSLVFV